MSGNVLKSSITNEGMIVNLDKFLKKTGSREPAFFI